MADDGTGTLRASGRARASFAAAALVYVLSRALIVVTAFDQVALWMYETYPIGAIAELRLRSIDVPLAWFYDNAAGQILSGLITIPAFALFGSSYLALKLVPFLLGFATFLLLFAFLRRHFGLRAGLLAAWLFALGPPTVVKYSVIASGNHFENLFFTLLAVWAFYRLHERPDGKWRLFASAWAGGLALFVFLGALIPVGILAGMHVGLRGLRRLPRDLAIAVPGFVLGLLPLLLLNATTGGRGLGFLEAKFAEAGGDSGAGGHFATRASEYLAVHLPAAGVFEPVLGVPGAVFAALFLGAFALSYLLAVPEAGRGLAELARGLARGPQSTAEARGAFERVRILPFVLYLPLAAAAYGLSNFRIGGHAPPIEVAGYRYFLPHFLFAAGLIAVVASRLVSGTGLRRKAGFALATAALVTGLSSWSIVDWSFARPNLGLYYQGHDLPKIARALLSSRNALSREEVVARTESFEPRLRRSVVRSIGFNLGAIEALRRGAAAERAGTPYTWSLDLAAMVAPHPETWHVELARGAGIALRFQSNSRGEDPRRLLVPLLMTLRAAGAEGRDLALACAEGAAQQNPSLPLASESPYVLDGNLALIDRSWRDRGEPAAREIAEALARGHGLLCGRLLARGIPTELALVARARAQLGGLAPELCPEFDAGLGASVAESGDGLAPCDALFELVPAEERNALWWGVGSGLHARERGVPRLAIDRLPDVKDGDWSALLAGAAGRRREAEQ